MRVVLVPVWGAGWLMQQQRWGCRPWACAHGSYSVDARLCIWPSSKRKEGRPLTLGSRALPSQQGSSSFGAGLPGGALALHRVGPAATLLIGSVGGNRAREMAVLPGREDVVTGAVDNASCC